MTARRPVHVAHYRVTSIFRASCAGELDRVVRSTVAAQSRESLHGGRWSIGASAVPRLLERLAELGWTVVDDAQDGGVE